MPHAADPVKDEHWWLIVFPLAALIAMERYSMCKLLDIFMRIQKDAPKRRIHI
jgi:hypothetical protein